MKNLKKVLALVLAVVMIMSVVTVASAKTYTDVKGTDNYANAIDALSSLKILDGFKNGDSYSFKAEDPFTRAQAAKIVAIVHNAATNGAIKDQDAISGLYSNAQNPFVDCNSSWALPFINYCRITGLADGMTATTYEPNRYVTGVQFLKLMLTTLNFDTAKEGYTGTGWDVNVLNRANEVGLTAGLADGWKAIAPITRGEAAQVLYNALTKYLVEYGQKVKNTVSNIKADTNKANFYYTESFISNEQVAKSGYTLGGKMGIKITAAHDVFMRPGYKWAYGSWSAFYLNNATKTYTNKVTACDILVDLGIAKTSKDKIDFVFFRDGRAEHMDGSMTHNANACVAELGGNGALTQVYKVTKNDKTYIVVTVIDTFLSKVTNVTTTKHGNPKGNTSAIDLYANKGPKFTNNTIKATVAGLTDYAEGDYVLFNVAVASNEGWYTGTTYEALYTADTKIYDNSTKDTYALTVDNNNEGSLEGIENTPAVIYAVDVQKATTIDAGKYTGRSLPDMDELTVNGTKYNVNCTFTLDEGDLDVKVLEAKTLDFFVDQYGNLIGDKQPSTTKAYGVLDGIYWTTAGSVYSDAQFAVAGLAKAGENAVTDIKAYKYNGTVMTGVSQNNTNWVPEKAYGEPDYATASVIKANNGFYTDSYRNYGVVSFTINEDGTYNLSKVGTVLNTTTVTKTNPNLGVGTDNSYYYADEYTVFMVKTLDKDGKAVYTSYTGIKDVPTIKLAKAVVAVTETGKTYASFVYVDATNSIFAGSTAVGYVGYDYRAGYEDSTTRLSYFNVYINGVKTTVEVDKTLASTPADIDRNIFQNGVGLYTLEFNSEGKLVAATYIDPSNANNLWHEAVVTAESEIVATFNAVNYTINYTDAKVYIVTYSVRYDVNGNVVANSQTMLGVAEGTKDDLVKGSTVLYKAVDADTPWMADTVYVFVEE